MRMVSNPKNFLYQNLDLIFIILFLALTLSLLWVPPKWDEGFYLDFVWFPLNPSGWWVPHPPLLWYLLAAFSLIPRMAILMCSLVSMLFLFYACKRLYGAKIARLAVAVSAANWLYMSLGSLIMFTDGPVTAFMTISTISFLCWLKLGEQKFLLISGLGLILASLTKYTAAPIILATLFIWLIVLGKHLQSAKILKTLGVTVVSLLPLVYWVYLVYQTWGSVHSYYFASYDPFSSSLPIFAFNIVFYAVCTLALINGSLISWVRQRQFDLDSKLLLAYIAVIFLFFAVIQKQDFGNFRYLLPMVPSIAIISARNMVKEKAWVRFSIMSIQFLFASIITYVALLPNLFIT